VTDGPERPLLALELGAGAVEDRGEDGSVERSPDPDDRRRNVVTITPAGAKELRRLDRVVSGVQEELLEPLPAADRAELVRLLTRLADGNR
jgi:DNA-binding MarR family transcriptional regulator